MLHVRNPALQIPSLLARIRPRGGNRGHHGEAEGDTDASQNNSSPRVREHGSEGIAGAREEPGEPPGTGRHWHWPRWSRGGRTGGRRDRDMRSGGSCRGYGYDLGLVPTDGAPDLPRDTRGGHIDHSHETGEARGVGAAQSRLDDRAAVKLLHADAADL